MSAILSVYGPLYRALAWWWWLARSSLVWFAGCLPLVTAPVATLWLLDAAARQLAGQPPADRVQTLALTKKLAWPALRLSGMHSVVLALLLGAALGPSPGGVFDLVLPAVVLCVGATWLLLAPWSMVLLTRRQRGARDAFVQAYLISIRSPLLAAAGVVALAAGVGIVILSPPQVTLLVLLTVPGLAACLLTVLCDRAESAASRRAQ